MSQAEILGAGSNFLDLFVHLRQCQPGKVGGYQQQEPDQRAGAGVPFQILPSNKELDFPLNL